MNTKTKNYLQTKNIKNGTNGKFVRLNNSPPKKNVKITHYEEILIRARRGEELEESDLHALIGVNFDCVNKMIIENWYPVLDKNKQIIDFSCAGTPIFLLDNFSLDDWYLLNINYDEEYTSFVL